MTWVWILFAALAVLGGLRYIQRIGSMRSSGSPPVDDDALRRIVEDGSLSTEEDEPLDLEEAARAEEEFWNETWDEPDER
jgi:hypothetical protein